MAPKLLHYAPVNERGFKNSHKNQYTSIMWATLLVSIYLCVYLHYMFVISIYIYLWVRLHYIVYHYWDYFPYILSSIHLSI